MRAADALAQAWLMRALRASEDVHRAASAPALFRPEWVAQRRAEQVRALRWSRYFSSGPGAS